MPKFSTTRYKDCTPKVAAAYDLFGDGRTALKVQLRQVRARAGARRRRSGQPARLQRAAHVVADLGRQRPQLHPRLRPDRIHGPGPDAAGVDRPGRHLRRRRRRRTPTSTTTRCARTWPCRTTPATAGASGRTAGSSRSSAQHELNAGPVGQRRRVLALVRQLPGHRQHVRRRSRDYTPVLGHASR